MINAGKMRQIVRLEQRSTTPDAAGEPLLEWTLFAQRRASIERTPGGETFSAAQRQGRVPTTFKLRYLPGVLPAMRLICDAKVYNILSAAADDKNSELVITAEELVEAIP